MKLYNVYLSPFAARCRIQIYAKNLAVDLVEPPGGLQSASYKAIAPIGKVPFLDAEGFLLPESELICEYLEDRFPEPSLRPAAPEARAHMRLVSRMCDLYLNPPMGVLFDQLNPKNRDEKLVGQKVEEVRKVLGLIDRHVGSDGLVVGGKLSLGDCALIPMLFFVVTLGAHMGLGDAPLANFPNLAAAWAHAGKDTVLSKVTGELGAALAKANGG
jgi:glutathione S-transferase